MLNVQKIPLDMNRAKGYKYDGINIADKIINGEKIKKNIEAFKYK